MTSSILVVLALVALTLVLFMIEAIPLEVTALAVVGLLALSGVLTPAEAFAGFSSETVVFVFALLAMTEGLRTTGLIHRLGGALAGLRRLGAGGFLAGMMALVAGFSAFVSNTATTAALLPATIQAARSAGLSRTTVLMPLAFASMLGGMSFLYGTSTNLVVSARLAELGLGGLGVLELTPVGLPLALLGIALVVLLAPRMLRARGRSRGAVTAEVRHYLTELELVDGAGGVGQPLAWLERRAELEAVCVVRGPDTLVPEATLVLRRGDRVVLRGARGAVLRLPHAPARHVSARRSALTLAEAVLTPTSSLVGLRLRDAQLPERLGVGVLALYRHPSLQLHHDARGSRSLRRVRLHAGDALLLVGPAERLRALAGEPHALTLLSLERFRPQRPARALAAAGIFAATLLVASLGLLPAAVAGVAGVLLMLATGCLDARHAFRVDWRVLVMIAAMMALGVAMERSGAGAYLGERAASLAGLGGARLVLLALMVLTVALSIPMSNQAAALVVLPVALGAAETLGVNARPFALGIALAASCSFVTPLEPSCMMVYGPGRYRFADFFKLGGLLTAVMLVALAVLVPAAWPL